MKKLLLTLLTFLIAVNVAYPQLAIRHRLATPRPADSLDIDYYSHKRGLQAGTMVFGINMGVWTFDRYIRKADFAYINGRTIKDNLKHGFVWDNDAMGTNMFMHPYHGSLYFNSARSNGYNFWQSDSLLSAAASCGRCLWRTNIPLPTTSLPPLSVVWPWAK